MTGAPLTVRPLGADRYEVVSGDHSYTVDASHEPPECGCDAYHYRPTARPCKHGWAVVHYRAEPQGRLLDSLSAQETLDVIDPSHGGRREPRTTVAVDPEDRAVAMAALQKWAEVRTLKPKPQGYYGLWRAACEAMNGVECEQSAPSQAAESFAVARAWVERIGENGQAA